MRDLAIFGLPGNAAFALGGVIWSFRFDAWLIGWWVSVSSVFGDSVVSGVWGFAVGFVWLVIVVLGFACFGCGTVYCDLVGGCWLLLICLIFGCGVGLAWLQHCWCWCWFGECWCWFWLIWCFGG